MNRLLRWLLCFGSLPSGDACAHCSTAECSCPWVVSSSAAEQAGAVTS